MYDLMMILAKVFKYYLIFYVLLIGSYAFEHFYIEYLESYWDIMPDDIFMEEIISILSEYDKKIIDLNKDDFIKKSRILYRNNIKLRVKLFKYGLKDRFIKYFNI